MSRENIYFLLLLLLGIVLCVFLGSKYVSEGFTYGNKTIKENFRNDDNNVNDFKNGLGSGSNNHYDNYNHYTGTFTHIPNGNTFYGENGGSVVVNSNSDGSQTLQVRLTSGQSPVVYTSKPSSITNYHRPESPITVPSMTVPSFTVPSFTVPSFTVPSFKTPPFTPPSSISIMPLISSLINAPPKKEGFFSSANIFYGPNGEIASLNSSNGQPLVQISTSSGKYTYSQNNLADKHKDITSTQYYGSTGYPIQPKNITSTVSQNVNSNNLSNSYSNIITNDYSNSLPKGIPKTQIPPGQEDLYILKTQVVPPVCPVCPACKQISKIDKEDGQCPPCPPCGRCNNISPLTYKAVPNYSALDSSVVPQPVLNDFSQFGM
jgi:hypothetical protein